MFWPILSACNRSVSEEALDMVRFSVIAAPEISVPVILMLPDVLALNVAMRFLGTSGWARNVVLSMFVDWLQWPVVAANSWSSSLDSAAAMICKAEIIYLFTPKN